MPNYCEICRAVSTKENISFFCVPKDEARRQRWKKSCGVDFKENSRICQNHFDKSDIISDVIKGIKWCRLMPNALPKAEEIHYSRNSESLHDAGPQIYLNNRCHVSVSIVEKNQSSTPADGILENISGTDNGTFVPKDEVEISLQDLEFDDHYKRKCGEIVLDTYDNSFILNCSLCSTICLDLIAFSKHVIQQHDSLFEQYVNFENKLDAVGEETLEVDYSRSESFEVGHDDIQNPQLSEEDNEEIEDFEIEFVTHEDNKSDTDCSSEIDMENVGSEIDFKNQALVTYFIKLLRQKPFIWSTAISYDKRRKGLLSVIELLSKKFPALTFTYKNLFALLKVIRNAYENEMKQMKLTEDSGIEYIPQLWCFDKLRFVENLNGEVVSVQQKIDSQKRIAVQVPLDIYENDEVGSEATTVEIVNHYKEQQHLWNISHPEYSGKFQEIGIKNFYEFLCPKYSQIAKLSRVQFKMGLEQLLKWYSAVEDIRLHTEKLNQPFISYYPCIYESLDFLRGHVSPFRCHICDKIYYHEIKFVQHKRCCGVVVHECKHCFKRFQNAGNLKSHISIHSDERPFVCNICGMSFRAKIFLNRHIRRHEIKPFKCDICQRAYRSAYFLRVHQKSHLGIRDYICHVCGKTFTSSKYMYNHRITHFKEYNRKCNNCGKELKAASMTQHKKTCMTQLLKKNSTKRPRRKKGTTAKEDKKMTEFY